VFPQCTMGAHVSHAPNWQTGRPSPLHTRVNVAMMGSYGYEMDLNELDDEAFEQTKRDIAYAKENRELLLYGDLIRLRSPFDGSLAAWMTVSPDQRSAIVTAVRLSAMPNARPEMLLLSGLDGKKMYRIRETGSVLSGAELMNYGISLAFAPGDYESLRFTLTQEVS